MLCTTFIPADASADFDAPTQIGVVTVSTVQNLKAGSNPGNYRDSWPVALGGVRQTGFVAGDFSGDNGTDLACIDIDDSDTPMAFITRAPGANSGDQAAWTLPLRSAASHLPFFFSAGDFNGDGNSDLAYFYLNRFGDSSDVYVKLTFGPDGALQTTDPADWQLSGQRNSAFIIGRFLGNDSIDDIAAFSDNGSGGFLVKFYQGPNGTFAAANNWTIPGVAASNPVAFRDGDINGDGSRDIVALFYTPGNGRYTAKIVLGPAGGTVKSWDLGATPYSAFLVSDFDNDGFDDLAGVTESGADRSAKIAPGSSAADLGSFATWSLADATESANGYVAGQFTYAQMSGTVLTDSGAPLTNVSVGAGQFGAGATGVAGTYTVPMVLNGADYTATPTYTGGGLGYRFTPSSVSGRMAGNVTINFTAYKNYDTDGDGTFDHIDTDDDNDGLSDDDEIGRGTDPLDADSDGDSVNDGQEVSDGTDPLDSGSFILPLSTTQCSDWNGFLGGMWNVQEHVNRSTNLLRIESRLYDLDGVERGYTTFDLPPGQELDLLVHEIPGWNLNSYGKICSTVIGGTAGDLDGRMVYYKVDQRGNPNPLNPRFDFAFGVPFINGIKGSQFVPYNTYQPSLDWVDAHNLVANWIQVSNLDSQEQSGTLIFYSQDGSIAGQERVTVSAAGRRDISAHKYGSSLVGIAEWRPDDSNAEFHIHNSRYFYDNPYGWDNFSTAYQFDGIVGTGRRLTAPIDTSSTSAIVEISNTRSFDVGADIEIYDSAGTPKLLTSLVLAPYSTVHVIADGYLRGAKGSVTVQSAVVDSLIATAMHYGRNPWGGVTSIYGIQAKEALGSSLQGSYHTWLNQGCRLLLTNPTSIQQGTSVSLTRSDGTPVVVGQMIDIPAHGMYEYDACAQELPNNTGIVLIQPDQTNGILASIIRIGNHGDYRFVTPVR